MPPRERNHPAWRHAGRMTPVLFAPSMGSARHRRGLAENLEESMAAAAHAKVDATVREAGATPGLTETEAAVLAFERQWWKYAGAKETAIRELFDMSATRYYQVLNQLLDSEAALAADPMLVKRLRRMRSSRQRERSSRRLGSSL
jgi:hypothetical protein